MSHFMEPFYTDRLKGRHPITAWFDNAMSQFSGRDIDFRLAPSKTMMPNFDAGDIVLIDRDIRETVRNGQAVDGIYDFTVNNQRHIKYITHSIDDDMLIIRSETNGKGERVNKSKVHIHGYMVGVIKCQTLNKIDC